MLTDGRAQFAYGCQWDLELEHLGTFRNIHEYKEAPQESWVCINYKALIRQCQKQPSSFQNLHIPLPSSAKLISIIDFTMPKAPIFFR